MIPQRPNHDWLLLVGLLATITALLALGVLLNVGALK